MANLFFTFPGELQAATQIVFQALGAASTSYRDSLNVLGGTYSVWSVLGFNIKLEANSYDHEDTYNYMLSVGEDYLANLKVDNDMAEALAELIAKLLSSNASIEIAQEKASGLVIHPALAK